MSPPLGKFTVEQPAGLNYLVDDSIPLTWAKRWRVGRPSLPLIAICVVLFSETILFNLWISEQMSQKWSLLIIGPLSILVVLCLSVELHLRVRHWSKRRLWITKRGVIFQSQKHRCLWKSFAGFRFERVTTLAPLRRCLVLVRDEDGSLLERHGQSIVLDESQRNALKEASLELCPSGHEPLVFEEPQMILPPSPRYIAPLKPLIIAALALWLLFHGWILVTVSISAGSKTSRSEPHEGLMTGHRREQIRNFMKRHFSSGEEARKWVFWSGAGLFALGVTVGVSGRKYKRKPLKNDVNSSSQNPAPTELTRP